MSDFHIVYHTVIPNEFLHLYITGLINWKSTPSEHAAIPVSMMKGKNLFVLSLAHWIEKIMVGNTCITNYLATTPQTSKVQKGGKKLTKLGHTQRFTNLAILEKSVFKSRHQSFKICDIIYCFFFILMYIVFGKFLLHFAWYIDFNFLSDD